jgi:hypothetical protein
MWGVNPGLYKRGVNPGLNPGFGVLRCGPWWDPVCTQTTPNGLSQQSYTIFTRLPPPVPNNRSLRSKDIASGFVHFTRTDSVLNHHFKGMIAFFFFMHLLEFVRENLVSWSLYLNCLNLLLTRLPKHMVGMGDFNAHQFLEMFYFQTLINFQPNLKFLRYFPYFTLIKLVHWLS